MPSRFPTRTALTALAALGCLLLVPAMAVAQSEPPAPGQSSQLRGKIFQTDGKTPAPGVRILAYHLSTEQAFKSEPTNAKGEYIVTELPYGYFDLAIETADGLFVANQVVNIPPQGKVVLSISLTSFDEGAPSGDSGMRDFPGSDQKPSGVASVSKKLRGREFWSSPKGIAIIAGAGAGALVLVAGGSSSSSSVSPSTP